MDPRLIHPPTQTALHPPTVLPPLVSQANTTLSVCLRTHQSLVHPALRPHAPPSHNLATTSPNQYQRVVVCHHPDTTPT